jgi:hypothetical protein
MISYIIYGIYNLVFQIVSIGFLFYVNTYLNGFIIPDRLRWKNGELREDLPSLAFAQATVLIIEAALLLLLIYYVNKWYLSNVVGVSDPGKIALWTAGIYAVITVGVILVTTYLNFK